MGQFQTAQASDIERIILNLSIDMAGIILCILSLLVVSMFFSRKRQINRYFSLLFIMLGIYALSNLIGLLLRGSPGPAVRAVLIVSNFLEYALGGVLVYLVFRMILSLAGPEASGLPLVKLPVWLLSAHLLLVTVSQFTGLLYTIDAENVYHRAAGYPFGYVLPGFMMLLTV